MKIILNGKYDIANFNEGITLSEAIDGVAYKMDVSLIEPKQLKDINIKKGDKIVLIDIAYESKKEETIFDGVIWETRRSEKSKKLTLSCRERTVYMEESEEQYSFKENTATQRIEYYCKQWNIPYYNLANTSVKLAKVIHKTNILDMIKKDLKETASKGGDLFRVRMDNKLKLFKLGTNANVYKLDSILEDANFTSSFNDAVTSVKVLGKSKDENTKAPIIGTYKKDSDKYGTLQKIKQDEKIKNTKEAKKAAEAMFNSGEETISVDCVVDINRIRAGDKVSLKGKEYYVIDVTHTLDSTPKMKLNIGTLEYIRRKFYNND
ncbi:TPA: XkdQ [Clostridioides difficile]|uniref:XkdQ/YqbQ family protein n=2 Tax=Clostridioides difficile TaxID=1496 RepID=UPI0009396A8A|nr:XkdQ [Clostridioides difficile]QVW56740.1 XkdQ [Clostridioides phage phiCD418]MDB2780663.1 XkdQ [Clostridioides difficile]OYO86966.1 XkdQ [Clostridioides difficile]SJW04996.1 phage-like element PBSX protein xkdQ [Clostridioides difficile]HBE9311888.1 XkdQ [Clostridioides difficile]